MKTESFRYLAALIAAHQNGEVVGRIRLQKEVKLLQRLGFPTDYPYSIHFYGPYSDALQSDIGLMEAFNLVEETCEVSREGNPYYILRVKQSDDLPIIDEFRDAIAKLQIRKPVILELAATYDAFRENGCGHLEAIERLRRKKGSKCDGGNEKEAMILLSELGLEAE